MRSSGNTCKRISNADLAESSTVDDSFVQPLKKQKALSNFRVYHPLNLHYCPLYYLLTPTTSHLKVILSVPWSHTWPTIFLLLMPQGKTPDTTPQGRLCMVKSWWRPDGFWTLTQLPHSSQMPAADSIPNGLWVLPDVNSTPVRWLTILFPS